MVRLIVPSFQIWLFIKQQEQKNHPFVVTGVYCLGFDFSVGHQSVASRSGRKGREKVSVLGRVGRVDQQPSGEPEVDGKGGQQQGPGDEAVVSREEEVQAGVDNVTNSGNPHGHTKVAREDSPQADGSSEQDHEHTSKDLLEVESVLVDDQKQVGKLGSDRRHVVRVEVFLDNFVKRAAAIQQESGTNQEDDVGGADCLLDNLEGTDGDSGSGVDTGSDHDKTKGDSDDNVNDADEDFEEDAHLEGGHVLGDLVGGLFGLEPFNQDPSDSDGGVDGGDDGDSREDTGGQGRSSEALSSLLELLAFLVVGGFGIRHLDELIFGRHDELVVVVVGWHLKD